MWLAQLSKFYNLFFGIEKIQSHYHQLHYIEYTPNLHPYSKKYGLRAAPLFPHYSLCRNFVLFIFLHPLPSQLPQFLHPLSSHYELFPAQRIYILFIVSSRNYNSQIGGMIPSNRSIPALKYSVLKPNHKISSLKRAFAKPHPRCPYELAAQDHLSVRKYRRVVESLDSILQDYQWRHQQKSPIAHCLYIELMPPTSSRGIGLEIYIQDMECPLSKMKKLLLPEALFLIKGAAQGYGALWDRFKQVSVGEQTIGLDSNGNCMVWTNPSLERNQSDDCRIAQPQEIAVEVVSLIREKSEPVCEGMLTKLLELLAKEGGDFRKIGLTIDMFAKNCKTNIPLNLRYLVHQERLTKNCEGIKTQRSIHEEKQRNPFNSRRFIFSRNSLASLRVLSPKSSPRGIASTLRKTTSPNSNLMIYRSNKQQHNKSVDSSIHHDDPKVSKVHDSVTDRQKLFPFLHSRSKSQTNECIQIINNIRPKKEAVARSNEQIKEAKKVSNISDNAKTAESFNRSKTNHNSESEVRSTRSGLVCQQIVFSPNNKAPPLGLYSSKECQSYECSPFIIKEEQPNTSSTNLLSQSSDAKFKSIPEFFRANKWTPTLKNLMEARTNLEHSVTQGQDVNHYLSDVRLQKLECLGKHMAVSLIPQRSAKKVGQ